MSKLFIDENPGCVDDYYFISVVKDFKIEICDYFKININSFNVSLDNIQILNELSGCNSHVCLLNFYDKENNKLSKFCLKHSFGSDKESCLKNERDILKLLNLFDINSPKVIGFRSSVDRFTPCILMEFIQGHSVDKFKPSLNQVDLVIDKIIEHQLVIRNNLITPYSFISDRDLGAYIDFEMKVKTILASNIPNFTVHSSLGFLNDYLNDAKIIRERVVVTDRSAENIIFNNYNEVTLIDFSTLRVGTKFDNIIQFIDDPRTVLPVDKNILLKQLFNKFNFSKDEIKYYYVASIYTNLLQGIYTYSKNPKIAIDYIKNANLSFEKLINKKSVLIVINH
jgi:tRNA A-37 threonylcarbamoyl transferase component Bud32